MTVEYSITVGVIAFFAIIQSIFGIGILVFGTPTLLLFGYDFLTALSFLLPASFAISLLQVFTAGANRVAISKNLYWLCLPGIFIGLLLTERIAFTPWMKVLIAAALLFSALIRFWPRLQALLTSELRTRTAGYHLIMGLVHGLTNLGGALLTILAGSTNDEKYAIRYTVAYYYLAFSIVQMLVIAFLIGRYDVLISNSPTAIVSALVYLLIGNRIFTRTSNPTYHAALTVFMAVYGVAMLVQGLSGLLGYELIN